MADNVINLDDHRKTPHLRGNAQCLHCKHRWEAVAPVGVLILKCPNCELEKGVYACLVMPDVHWRCGSCGNVFFAITPTAAMCAMCGEEQVFP